MDSNYPNILQIAPIPTGSTKQLHARLQGIVMSLTELGYDSVICTYAESKTITGAENLRVAASKKEVTTHDQLEKLSFSSNIKLAILSIKTFHRVNPVAIHAYGFRGMTIALLIKLCFFWKRTPTVFDLGEASINKITNKSKFSVKGLLAKTSSLVTCSNQNGIQSIEKNLGLNSRKISLVVNGINSHSTIDHSRKNTIREKLKLSSHKTIVVINESLEKSPLLKDIQKTIFACKNMGDELHFLIIGSPEKYLYRFLKKYHLRDMCTLIGEVNPRLLPQYYSVSNIALTPSHVHQDNDRVKLLTFMANELPVLAYDGKNQQHFLPENTPLSHSLKEIVQNLKDLHHNKERQKNLAFENAKRFKEYYSWEVSKEQLYASYAQVLS